MNELRELLDSENPKPPAPAPAKPPKRDAAMEAALEMISRPLDVDDAINLTHAKQFLEAVGCGPDPDKGLSLNERETRKARRRHEKELEWIGKNPKKARQNLEKARQNIA